MTWMVRVHDAAAKQLEAIPPDRRRRILDDIIIIALEKDPFQGLVKALRGKEHKGKFRKVSGRYRIYFQNGALHEDRGCARNPSPQRENLPPSTCNRKKKRPSELHSGAGPERKLRY